MKKRAIIIVIVWALFLGLVWPYREKAHADVLTAGAIGAAAYALFTDWGISFTAANSSATAMQDWMEGQINDYQYQSGMTLSELFGTETLKIVAGKLIVVQTLYNGIIEFKDWLVDKYKLSSSSTILQAGTLGGQPLGTASNPVPANMNIELPLKVTIRPVTITGVYVNYFFDYNQTPIQSDSLYDSRWYLYELDYANCYFYKENNIIWYRLEASRGGVVKTKDNTLAVSGIAQTEDSLNANFGPYYVDPVVLNPDKEWSGLIGGQDWPDTNIDELIGSIYEDVADNNIDVEGEIIDIPVPPTPQPTLAPDIPLQDVPWEGLNDLIDNSTDSITESIGEAASDITGSLESTQEAVESLEETITESLDVPAASEITGRKFDLSTLFPFCIPFDIYRMLQAFDGTPEAPHVQLPFVIQSIGFTYTFDLDFSAFDSVAAILRTVEFIAFGIFLAFSTSKVIRW